MSTRELLKMTTVDKTAVRQSMDETSDLDGFREVALYVNVQNLAAGTSTLDVKVLHAARNRSSDYLSLAGWTGITTGYSSWSYVTATSNTGFLRYLQVEASWRSANSTTTADVEVLAVPKK